MRIAKSDETRQMTWANESQNRGPDPTIFQRAYLEGTQKVASPSTPNRMMAFQNK